MKTLLNVTAIIIVLSVLNINVNAQSNNDSSNLRLNFKPAAYTEYLKKSHDQKVAAIVMVTGGSIMLLTGISLAASWRRR